MRDAVENLPAPPIRRRKRKAQVTAPIKTAIRLLATGECTTQRAAAARVGVTPEYLNRQLHKPHVREWRLSQAREHIDGAVLQAAHVKVKLLEANSEHARNDAATDILAMGGISPPERPSSPLVNIALSPGYVIDLTGGRVTPDKTIEAHALPPAEGDA
jgi:hypothetical protein